MQNFQTRFALAPTARAVFARNGRRALTTAANGVYKSRSGRQPAATLARKSEAFTASGALSPQFVMVKSEKVEASLVFFTPGARCVEHFLIWKRGNSHSSSRETSPKYGDSILQRHYRGN